MADKKKIVAATAGAAVAAGITLAVGRKLAKPTGNGPSREIATYHVTPNGEGWSVGTEHGNQATSRHDTKRGALSAARDLANARTPSRLVIHGMDGTIQAEHSYGDET